MADPLTIDRIEIPGTDLDLEFSRSGGPGGQHVNTTDTRVRLWFRLGETEALSDAVKARLRQQQPAWITADDHVVITCDTHRSRHRNIQEVRDRLASAIRAALKPPRVRKKTKPSKRAKARRLDEKKRRSVVKKTRKPVRDQD